MAVPELQGEPAAAPWAWTRQFDVLEPQFERRMFELGGGRMFLGKKVDLAGLIAFIDRFDGTGPCGAAAVIDLSQIKQCLLDGSVTRDAAVFHDASVTVLFAVLQSFVGTQKHILPPALKHTAEYPDMSIGRVSTTGVFGSHPLINQGFQRLKWSKIVNF